MSERNLSSASSLKMLKTVKEDLCYKEFFILFLMYILQGKVVMKLSTKQDIDVHCVKARILILVDISGSMGIKYDRRRKHSKLSRMKKFAIDLVDSLDDGDFASVVTFGEKTNVLVPLQEISSKTRVRIY